MAYIPFINTETGEIDHGSIPFRADARACREFGGPNPPPAYIRAAVSWCIERARSERKQWQRERGLPVDGEQEKVAGFNPDWGNSGDGYSFRRDR